MYDYITLVPAIDSQCRFARPRDYVGVNFDELYLWSGGP